MPTCVYMFPTLSKYANHYHYNAQIYKLVGHAYSELIICIKETYISTNVQLISCACYDIYISIRWSYKATPKIRYWPSIHHDSSNKHATRKSYKTTPISHLSTCPHVYTCSLHCGDIPSIIIPSKKICKLVRNANSEMIICIKQSHNPKMYN